MSDYKIIKYNVSEGYLNVINENGCNNNYKDSQCLKIRNRFGQNVWGFHAENKKPVGILDYEICWKKCSRTFYKCIREPIGSGWQNLWYSYIGHWDNGKLYADPSSVFLVIPVYIYLNNNVEAIYFATIKVTYAETVIIENTKLERGYKAE